MFSAMSALLSSLARRLMPPLRRRKSITSSSSSCFAARRPFFLCGAGRRDVSESPFVAIRRRGAALRKVKPGRIGERKRGKGGDHHLLYGDGDGDEACVWQRAILLGRRCQPLEFTGAIHYDCEGQRLWLPRTPPQSSPLLASPAHGTGTELIGYMDRA